VNENFLASGRVYYETKAFGFVEELDSSCLHTKKIEKMKSNCPKGHRKGMGILLIIKGVRNIFVVEYGSGLFLRRELGRFLGGFTMFFGYRGQNALIAQCKYKKICARTKPSSMVRQHGCWHFFVGIGCAKFPVRHLPCATASGTQSFASVKFVVQH